MTIEQLIRDVNSSNLEIGEKTEIIEILLWKMFEEILREEG